MSRPHGAHRVRQVRTSTAGELALRKSYTNVEVFFSDTDDSFWEGPSGTRLARSTSVDSAVARTANHLGLGSFEASQSLLLDSLLSKRRSRELLFASLFHSSWSMRRHFHRRQYILNGNRGKTGGVISQPIGDDEFAIV